MREMADKDRKSETISFRIDQPFFNFLQELARRERRKPSEIYYALIERGAAAYRRDRQLFEPENQRRVPVAHEAQPRKRTPGEQKKTGTDNR